MFNCIIFCSSRRKYLQFPIFSDKLKFLLKSKMAAILAAILGDVTDPIFLWCIPYLIFQSQMSTRHYNIAQGNALLDALILLELIKTCSVCT